MTISDELPKTKQGLINYINHCDTQIKASQSLIRKLTTRRKRCEESLEVINE